MILTGQYDSPFVRRVAVSLHYYDMPFERRVLSVFRDFEKMLQINPLGKVPVLEIDNGEVLFDSRYILDYLEEQAPTDVKLLPSEPRLRRHVHTIDTVALGLAEKTYERGIEFARRDPTKRDERWIERLKTQINSALKWLEEKKPSPYFTGDKITRADITCATAYRFLVEKQPKAIAHTGYLGLGEHCRWCEELDFFASAPYSKSEAEASGWTQGER